MAANTAEIRRWATAQELDVPARGPLPEEIVEAYEAAHPDPVAKAASEAAAPADPEPKQQKKTKAAAKKAGPAPLRAGGYVDRGDGRGWVLDDTPPKAPPRPPEPKPSPAGPSRAGGWVLPGREQE